MSGSKPKMQSSARESLRSVMTRRRQELQEVQEMASSAVFDPYANANSANNLKRKPTGVVYDLECLKHKCTWDEKYPENPKRLASVFSRCMELGLISRCKILPNTRNDVHECVVAKHSEELYQKLQTISENMTPEAMEGEAMKYDAIYFNKHTFDAACRSLSCVLNLVTSVAEGKEIQNGMALVRPPGHHAMYNEFCGYCYFNNVAIAAEMCIQEKLAKKILIVDYDVHHGQGTQQLFYDRNDVLYFSIHRYEDGTFWPNLIESNFNFIGKGSGTGYNINFPLNATGLKDEDYLAIIFNILLPVAYEFNPDLIIVSAGYDAAIGCPEGQMDITPGFYAHLITLLSGLAKGKIAVCLEGGYFLPSLAEGAALTLKSLLGDSCPVLDPTRYVHPTVTETINNLRSILYEKWDCFKMFDLRREEYNHYYRLKYFGDLPQPPYLTRNCYPLVSNTDKKYYTKLIEALRERYEYGGPLPVCYVYDKKMLLHKPEFDEKERPERPERISSIHEMFCTFGLLERLVKLEIVERDYSEYNIQNPKYIEDVNSLNLTQQRDAFFNSSTNVAISTAVSGLLTVVDSVMNGQSSSGVALIRPPGHHAEYDEAMGFCFINNIAVAANYLIKKYQLERVLILDFDVHHGNGTQNLFYTTKNVMYLSIHRFDQGTFFPNSLRATIDTHGFGPGQGYNVNIPFSVDKMGDTEYLAAFHNIILPIAYSYGPQVVLVSAGFDAGINDILGGYQVTPETFGHFVQLLKPLAGGKLILSLEGGYNLATTSYAMTICTKVLLGDPIPMPNNLYKNMSKQACETLNEVSSHFKKYWPMLSVNQTLPTYPVICKPLKFLTPRTEELYQLVDENKTYDSEFIEKEIKKLLDQGE